MKDEREELARLRKENRELRMERDLLKKRRPSSPDTSSSLRDDCCGEGRYPLSTMCRTFGVSPSGFHAWRARPESARAKHDRRLKVLVHASLNGGRGYYGSPRIYISWSGRSPSAGSGSFG
jgi:putative transposase